MAKGGIRDITDNDPGQGFTSTSPCTHVQGDYGAPTDAVGGAAVGACEENVARDPSLSLSAAIAKDRVRNRNWADYTVMGVTQTQLAKLLQNERSYPGDLESYRVYGSVPPLSGVTHVRSTYGKLFQNLEIITIYNNNTMCTYERMS